jgi:hypothetical protein
VKTLRPQTNFVLILIFAICSPFYITPLGAKSFGTIYISPNGSIEPSTAPILRVGDVYILSENVYDNPIVLERNNLVFDGGGYALQGAKTGTALNITCSNVTVENLRILNGKSGCSAPIITSLSKTAI